MYGAGGVKWWHRGCEVVVPRGMFYDKNLCDQE
jgi:hypothetical protein